MEEESRIDLFHRLMRQNNALLLALEAAKVQLAELRLRLFVAYARSAAMFVVGLAIGLAFSAVVIFFCR